MTQTTPARAVAIIPARGGSKGVPLKNLQKVAGVSLLGRAVNAVASASGIEKVVVSTDHDGIAEEARRHGAEVVYRPAELSGDHASSESALLHALDSLDEEYAVTVFVQATSPFIDSDHISRAIAKVTGGSADSVFSGVEDHSFLWTTDDSGAALAVGHDAAYRPRRQDRRVHFNETGAFYVMRTEGFRAAKHRFFGRTMVEPVPPEHSMEIDSMSDLTLVRTMAQTREDTAPLEIEALVTDFDGVHTDDSAWVSEDGVEHVRVHRGDGLGMSRLVRSGFPVMILSKERNPVVSRRGEKLGVEVRQGIDDKARVLQGWLSERGLDPDKVAYVGNDINDLEAFAVVGWPIAVADAHPSVLAAARVILTHRGGHGAIREVCDLVPISLQRPIAAVTP